ncbi:hypothetical protein [Roseibium sp. Sym1]|uniref:hypothetical protein n=1 Tax=Roseibium sp. Sym1 TaxID=3016006 RepID=UPI0022B5D087|nr:hypothetical protein [Roseibium sp. Sym1]
MAVSRRTLLSMTMTGAAGLALTRHARAAAPTAATLAAAFTDHFGAIGYAWTDPLGMISGQSFNGGLRYDETRPEPVAGKSLFVQPAARVEDAEGAGTPGVLALFTICGLRVSEPAEPGALFGQLLTWLVEQRNLDPARLVFVSTEAFGPYRDRHELVRAGRIVQRDRKEAMAAGDGSGYFAPPGHPAQPAFETVSLHYPLPGTEPDDLAYPLQGYLEIGEVSITPLDRRAVGFEVGGFGLERLVMAEGGVAADFEASRRALLRLIESEATASGQPLPEGHGLFSRS